MSFPSAAVIDIGSNSIKLLVAAREPDGKLTALTSRTLETRISAGISRARPELSEQGMVRGLAAIQSLLEEANPFATAATVLVATSAVRDALNGPEFRARVKAATGQEIRILTGDEEANLIGRGLTCDPALGNLRNFYVFDLGGGSLEALVFAQRKIQQGVSLQLGCVRLTEKFVLNSSQPFSNETRSVISAYTRKTLAESAFKFSLSVPAVSVGTGGTIATVRAILGARHGVDFSESDSCITIDQLRDLLDQLAPLTFSERQQIPGLPPARADILPAALTTMIAIAETGNLGTFQNSLYNLRWGIVAEVLGKD